MYWDYLLTYTVNRFRYHFQNSGYYMNHPGASVYHEHMRADGFVLIYIETNRKWLVSSNNLLHKHQFLYIQVVFVFLWLCSDDINAAKFKCVFIMWLSNPLCVSRLSFRVKREPVSVRLWSFTLWWLQSFRERRSGSGCVTTTSPTTSPDRWDAKISWFLDLLTQSGIVKYMNVYTLQHCLLYSITTS